MKEFTSYRFTIPGAPVPQPRGRGTVMLPRIDALGPAMKKASYNAREFWHWLKKNSRAGTPYVPEGHPIWNYKRAVELLCGRAAKKADPDSRQAWHMSVVFIFARKQGLPPHRTLYAMSKNDLDNLEKGVMDGITKSGAIRDDGYICSKLSKKWYAGEGEGPKTIVELIPLSNRGEPIVKVAQPLLSFQFDDPEDDF